MRVLYEDNHIIVVIKPVNVPSQEDKTGDRDMLTMIKDYVKEKYDKPGNVYIGLIHRLDRPVGGIMVFARTSKAASRLSEEVRKVVSTMLINGIKDPRITSMISVTDVEVTNDLRYAFVYISILGGDKEASLEGLNSARGYIRREVGRQVKLRYAPEIIFKIDDSIERGMYMDELIKSVNKDGDH